MVFLFLRYNKGFIVTLFILSKKGGYGKENKAVAQNILN